MPELPEVETVVRGLQETVTGREITSVKVFRDTPIAPLNPKTFEKRLAGRSIQSVTRRAKYLVFQFDPGLYLLAHLRMTGKFIVSPLISKPEKHHRVWFFLDKDIVMVFDDMRCFGTLELIESLTDCNKLRLLGVEPLSSSLTVPYLKKCIAHSSSNIKNLLLNQTKIAGIGNIYASEILFDAQISPLRQGCQLKAKELRKVIDSTQKILTTAIQKNGTSISDFRRIDEQTGEFQNFLNVYGKAEQPCPRCSVPIQRIVQQQRSSFYCASCQQ
ncbi:MAG: bifunctional DNA-formamidopyrimidine glycosylase/DNA-(apurinic or apyrimidinic site) lyase [SAR324 cluster bacterium]|nr:bifunctional DNA-formamidopyrimidine glycosylase/DNA-(apurinic or apyrimidinic site) lyase [SAR324 cluster bacterium]